MAIRREDLERLQASFEWAVWKKRIDDALRGPILTIAVDQGAHAADDFDLAFDAEDPTWEAWADAYVAERVTQLSATTIDRVQRTLSAAFREGDAVETVIARLLDAVGEASVFSAERARTIAQTEAGTAYNVGSALVFRANGIEEVDIYDGDECDDACIDANGAVWSVDEFLANPLEHPNCQRWATPHDTAAGEE